MDDFIQYNLCQVHGYTQNNGDESLIYVCNWNIYDNYRQFDAFRLYY